MFGPRPYPGLDLNAFKGYSITALGSVIDQVPEWHTLLDNLNSQIGLRQCELQKLGGDRPPTRSLRPKRSTESLLWPKESDEHAIFEDENTVAALQEPLALTWDTIFPTPSTPKHTLHTISNDSPPRPGPAPLQRRTSQRQSVASCKSQAPKSRSMIIVYYDSAVQYAFEELVKLISASRGAMRKGKMAARMANMKKRAEMEAASDEEEPASTETPSADATNNGSTIVPGVNGLEADEDDSDLPKLQFVSTRRLGPLRDSSAAALLGNKASIGYLSGSERRMMMLPGYQRSPNGREPGILSSIFDELDAGLEWCQSMCEHAAYQFLRDGTCDTEITGIKKRLWEVKEIAEREKVKVQEEEWKEKGRKDKTEREKNDKGEEQAQEKMQEEPRDSFVRCTRGPDESRVMRSIQMHKSLITSKSLEVNKIEIDDEGYDDLLTTRQGG